MSLLNEQKEYTYADYLKWPEDERLEIIDGIVYSQVTPTSIHQKISGNLYLEIGNFLKGKECFVFAAPFTVRLPLDKGETDENKNKNVVEPDLTVICDKSKLDRHGYNGAPDFIIEIVSRSSIKRDNIVKLNKYQQAGVKEYWIVTPETENIMRYVLNEQGHYNLPDMYVLGEDEKISAKVFPDLAISLEDVFAAWDGL
ncbi:MAG: Uma2 family endonuclease [Pelosinus sp.]|nr:Uma2 family endonuclease [Pelosinus sp.]